MLRLTVLLISLTSLQCSTSNTRGSHQWISLFDGKSLEGWRVGEHASSFSVKDGMIVVNGEVGHLYYDGKTAGHDFKDFEFSAEVMTRPGANSGIYFHTAYQQSGWPEKGYEVQVNNSHTDWRRTGSLWGISDIREQYAKDNTWFTEKIIVKGKTISIYVDERLVLTYVEPAEVVRPEGMDRRILSSGTFALQAHDPGSTVYYRNLRVKLL